MPPSTTVTRFTTLGLLPGTLKVGMDYLIIRTGILMHGGAPERREIIMVAFTHRKQKSGRTISGMISTRLAWWCGMVLMARPLCIAQTAIPA